MLVANAGAVVHNAVEPAVGRDVVADGNGRGEDEEQCCEGGVEQ